MGEFYCLWLVQTWILKILYSIDFFLDNIILFGFQLFLCKSLFSSLFLSFCSSLNMVSLHQLYVILAQFYFLAQK